VKVFLKLNLDEVTAVRRLSFTNGRVTHMGRIFIYAKQGDTVHGVVDTEILVPICKQSARELRYEGFTVFEVPTGLSLLDAIAWINTRSQLGDVALALETAAFPSSNVRGSTVFYIANNTERQTHAEYLLQSLVKQFPSLMSKGVQPDTATEIGSLAFTRQVNIPSLVLSIGYVTNLDDRTLMVEKSVPLAQGIYKGLLLWSRRLAERGIGSAFSPIHININGQPYSEQGIQVEGNAYVPADMIDQFAIQMPYAMTARLLDYGGVAYIRAVDLREAGVSVSWEADTRTVLMQTLLSFKPEDMGNITGSGYLLQSDYEGFLNQINPEALQQFPEIAQLYQDEAKNEGVNPDVAFAQALLETNFFGFSASLKPTQNNFGGLGSAGGNREVASFPNLQVGVRAHIQHLKAYANEEALEQEVVDPRFHVVTRGVAPKVEQLSLRWSAKADYGKKVLAMLRRLYGFAGLL
jgi:hypothetical protein